MDLERDPWERQRGESDRAYSAFTRYRDMKPKRGLRRLAAELGINTKNLTRWSTAHNWVERCSAWDDECDRVAREAQLQAITEMRERHAEAAVQMQDKALARLAAMDPEAIGAADVVRLMVEGVKIERLARGEPETVQQTKLTGGDGGPVRVQSGPDLSKLSDAELAQLEALLSRAGGDADAESTA